MYGFYEIGGDARKSRAFNSASFDTIQAALDHVANITVCSDVDVENDAADVFTKFGQVFSIERA